MTIYLSLIYACIYAYPLMVSFKSMRSGAGTPFLEAPVLQGSSEKPRVSNLYYIVISIFMIIIIGFRGMFIGLDTSAYYNTYEKFKYLDWNYLLTPELGDYGFVFLQILLNKMNISFQVFLIMMSAFYIGTVSFIIKKYSRSPWFSYLIFIFFGYFTFSMSAIRQTIAISFCLVAFECMQQKKPFRFLITILIAATIHKSALIFLPVYFVSMVRLNSKTILMICLVGLCVFIFKAPLGELLNENARMAYEEIETGGNLMYLFLLGTVIIGLALEKPIRKRNETNIPFFYMMIFAIIIFPVTQFNPAVLRLHFYFSLFMIIYIPNLLHTTKDMLAKLFGYVSYAAVAIYFAWDYVFLYSTWIRPYRFFWD